MSWRYRVSMVTSSDPESGKDQGLPRRAKDVLHEVSTKHLCQCV